MSELADHDPVSGHLHTCDRRVSIPNPRCDCAALLYTIAMDAHLDLARVRWFLAHRFERDAGDLQTLEDVYDLLNPAWVDWQIADRPGDPPAMFNHPPTDERMVTASGALVVPTGEPLSARDLIDSLPPVRRTTGPTL